MKTWEMIKALAENPNLKFKRVGSDLTVGIMGTHLRFDNGSALLITHDPSGPEFAKGNLTADWELVREPVDFMTAVKAFSEGKIVICESTSFGKRRYDPTHGHTLIDDDDSSITYQEILNGKWYIK